jgi:signal transduction histidine kinase
VTSTAHGAAVAGWWPWVVLPAVASALVSTGLLFAALDGAYALSGEAWVNVPLAIGFTTVAAGIWFIRPGPGGLRRLAVLYTVVGLASASTLPTYGWGHSELSGADAAAWVSNWVWALGAAPLLGLGLLLYPDGELPGPRWRVAAFLGAAATGGLVASGAFRPGPLENLPRLDNPVGVGSRTGWAAVGDGSFVVLMAAALTGVAALLLRFRRAAPGGDERAQIGSFVVAGAVLVAVAILPLSGGSATALAVATGAALPFTVGWAVVRHRLLDRDAQVAQLNRRLDAVTASRRGLVTEREQERLDLRRELHDGLGPFLAAIGLGLRQLEQRTAGADADVVRGLADEAQRAVAEVRRICAGLRPETLDELGLSKALAAGVAPLERLGPRVTLSIGELRSLPAAVEVAAYRIVLEATTNAVRHADASHVRIEVAQDHGLRVSVLDDGTGWSEDARPGLGVPGMVERAEEVGGWLRIAPGDRRGTRVEAWLPEAPHG